MDILQYFKDLFKAEQESSSLKPYINEPLERSEEALETYEHWKRTFAKRRILDWLNMQYATFAISGESELAKSIDFLNTPSSKGFVIHNNDKSHDLNDIIHLFDYLKERVLEMNYKSYMSDTRTYNKTRNKNTWVETIERHYLKPRFKVLDDNTFDQRFGNITITLLFRNDKLINLKFSATQYHDRNYKIANTFNDLMRELLQ